MILIFKLSAHKTPSSPKLLDTSNPHSLYSHYLQSNFDQESMNVFSDFEKDDSLEPVVWTGGGLP